MGLLKLYPLKNFIDLKIKLDWWISVKGSRIRMMKKILMKIYLMICFQIQLPSHLRGCVRFESHSLSSLCIGDNNQSLCSFVLWDNYSAITLCYKIDKEPKTCELRFWKYPFICTLHSSELSIKGRQLPMYIDQ